MAWRVMITQGSPVATDAANAPPPIGEERGPPMSTVTIRSEESGLPSVLNFEVTDVDAEH